MSCVICTCSSCQLSPSAARKSGLCVNHGFQDVVGKGRAVPCPAQPRYLAFGALTSDWEGTSTRCCHGGSS